MLRVLVPHVTLPLTLDRFVVACDFDAVVFECRTAKGTVELYEFRKYFFFVEVSEWLVFHIAIDISG